jgi:hypothetical protein
MGPGPLPDHHADYALRSRDAEPTVRGTTVLMKTGVVERIAWDAAISGSVTFERLDPACTRVTVRLEGDRHDGRLRGDLDRFKAVIAARAS